MDRSWDRFQTQWQWGLEDIQRNFQRGQVRSGWAESGLNLRINQQQLQYGWQQEDIQEALRYATGRDRRRLLRQQERGAISFSMNMAGAGMQMEQIEVQRQWAEEDYGIALERHHQKLAWQTEEYAAQREFFEEEVALRRELQAITRETTMSALDREQRSLDNASMNLAIMTALNNEALSSQLALEALNAAKQVEINMTNDFATAVGNLGGSMIDSIQKIAASYSAIMGMIAGYAGSVIQGAIGAITTPGTPTVPETPSTPVEVPNTPSDEERREQFCRQNPGVDGCPGGVPMAAGGPVFQTMGAIVHQGEHVVPRSGALILREPEVIKLLSSILNVLREANRNGRGNVRLSIQTNDPRTGIDYGMDLARELELN